MIGILCDITRCIGCNECVAACVAVNHLERHFPLPQHLADGLSSQRWVAVVPQSGERYFRKSCLHCLEPACVSACPVGAMTKTGEGPVIYDPSRCLGCRYCMMACPFGVPRYAWESLVPYVRKCTLCYPRLREGKLPACVEACPNQALIFGQREDLIAQAHHLISRAPTQFVQKVYGEHDAGGTCILYVSDIPLDAFGYYGIPGTTPLPNFTAIATALVAPTSLGVMALMTGTWWVIQRRMKLMSAKTDSPAGGEIG